MRGDGGFSPFPVPAAAASKKPLLAQPSWPTSASALHPTSGRDKGPDAAHRAMGPAAFEDGLGKYPECALLVGHLLGARPHAGTLPALAYLVFKVGITVPQHR